VELQTSSGRQLHYGKLVIRDADGREIQGRIEVQANILHLLIADAGAVYPLVIDPLLTASADTQLESNRALAQFGVSVAGAGDVNGDGYADIVVGAFSYDAAFVYHGGPHGITPTAAVQLESNQGGVGFGQSVAGAGDINGDGYADVIVGAPGYDRGQRQTDEGVMDYNPCKTVGSRRE
jgi:hypothetical protein